jgi:hypothetical protein
MNTKKIKYVAALVVLLGCLIASSAEAVSLQGGCESKAIDDLGDQNTAPLSPSVTIPSPNELIGTQAPMKLDENVPLVIGPIVSPRESISIEPTVSAGERTVVITIASAITLLLGFALGYGVRAGVSSRRHGAATAMRHFRG